MVKSRIFLLAALCTVVNTHAENISDADSAAVSSSVVDKHVMQQPQEDKLLFNHLSVSVTTGTTGVGLEVAMPVTKWAQLRTGFNYMPRFNHTMHFGVQLGDQQESAEAQQTKFEKLSGMLKSFMGTEVDSEIDMIGEPSFDNFKLMADIFPFKNKKWHLTVGFYYGGATVAKAWNAEEDMTSLVAMSMYNSMYERVRRSYESQVEAMNDPFAVPVPYMTLGGVDYYADVTLYNNMMYFGRMGVHIADHENGTPYRLEPDENNMVKVEVKTNKFRPYIGFGYGGALSKKDDTYSLYFDCGLMFWGGTPKIITHDGTNLSDLNNVRGKVGDYVKFIKAFPVFPVLNVRLTRKIF